MSREEGRARDARGDCREARCASVAACAAPAAAERRGAGHGGFSTPLLEGDRPKPRFRTLAEFIAEYKPIAEVIAGVLISGSLCTMTATTGTGKTALNRFDHRQLASAKAQSRSSRLEIPRKSKSSNWTKRARDPPSIPTASARRLSRAQPASGLKNKRRNSAAAGNSQLLW